VDSASPAPAPSAAASAPAAQPPQPAPFIPESPQPAAPATEGYPDLTPVPEWNTVSAVREAGTTWNIVGDGYAPGAEIYVSFGPMQTDSNLLDTTSVYADASGHYSMPITLSADLAPGTYGFLVVEMPFREEAKRFATVEVVAAS
jgi:hypothetical protein